MKKLMLGISVVIALLIIVGGFAYKSKSNLKKGDEILVVGTNAEYPPFTYVKDSEIVGFDIDLMKEISSRLGRKIVLKDMPFDSLIPATLVGSVQVIAAGMTSTSIRENKVLFSNPYLSDDRLQIVCNKASEKITSLNQLIGKKVIVNEGYTADLYFSSVCPARVEIMRLSAPADGFMALKSKRANAFITSRLTIQSFQETNTISGEKDFQICDIDDENAKDRYNFVISRKNSYLLKEINDALDQMQTDGTMDRIKKKWKIR